MSAQPPYGGPSYPPPYPQQPGGPYQPAPAPWEQQRPPADPLSISAFVCGLLGVLVVTIPVAVVLGVAGCVRTSGGKRRGRIFAVLGILAALLWAGLIAAVALVVLAVQVERDDAGNITEEATIDVFDVQPGDCLRSFDIDPQQRVEVLPCAQPHGGQVIAEFSLPDGNWPGTEAVAAQSERGCEERIANALGDRVDEGDLGLGYFHPEESSWDVGDRSVLCLVTAEGGGRLTESFDPAR